MYMMNFDNNNNNNINNNHAVQVPHGGILHRQPYVTPRNGSDHIQTRAAPFEVEMLGLLTRLGINRSHIETQTDIQARNRSVQGASTPDFAFTSHIEIWVNGERIHWIDCKATFGKLSPNAKKLKGQCSRYCSDFGNGLVVYKDECQHKMKNYLQGQTGTNVFGWYSFRRSTCTQTVLASGQTRYDIIVNDTGAVSADIYNAIKVRIDRKFTTSPGETAYEMLDDDKSGILTHLKQAQARLVPNTPILDDWYLCVIASIRNDCADYEQRKSH